MSTKAALKTAKSAIDSKNWDEAIEQANTVLAKDSENYFAKLFIGRALEGLGRMDSAAQAYNDATKVKPQDPQAWLGLRGLYLRQGNAKVDERIDVEVQLAQIYAELDDAHKAQTAIDGLVDHARRHGTKLQYARALATQLPTSPIYSYLEGRLPKPAAVYTRLAEIHEAEEASIIKRQIDERRSRLGATLEGTTIEVKNEVYGASPLEDIYQSVVDWTSDDEVRREYEEKLLQRAYDTLLVLSAGKKEAKREKVMKLAQDMVIIKHPYLLAWQIELEWRSGLAVEAH
ncbi:Superkiller protein 3 [Didymosphaeria variabile]|uniref:Superkiller protein 3 n=1 Tax=Didymosphaeria variabile TaxID=1932322 RepID=A0A9W9C8G2_9PLEO|nr:Superkiller protein 3 [Didymosphaeria variabile]KAJ4348374.1 Superkiller protein 3 [Didymosphaeria variabile]